MPLKVALGLGMVCKVENSPLQSRDDLDRSLSKFLTTIDVDKESLASIADQLLSTELSPETRALLQDVSINAMKLRVQQYEDRREHQHFGCLRNGRSRPTATPGREWKSGVDYKIEKVLSAWTSGSDEEDDGNGTDVTPSEGKNSVVVQARRHGQPLVLKFVNHFNNLRNDDDITDSELHHKFHREYELPCSKHVPPVQYYYGSPLVKYLPEDFKDAARRTVVVILPHFESGSLSSLKKRQSVLHPAAPFGMGWRFWALAKYQLLHCQLDLQEASIMHGDLKADQVVVNNTQVSVIDWGSSVNLRDGDKRLLCRDMSFLDTEQGRAPGALAPELRRRIHPGQIVYCDDFADSELWSIARIFNELLAEDGDVFYTALDYSRETEGCFPNWEYDDNCVPVLSDDAPEALRSVLASLARSDKSRRMTVHQALRTLGDYLWSDLICCGEEEREAQVRRAKSRVLVAALAGDMPYWEALLATEHFDRVR